MSSNQQSTMDVDSENDKGVRKRTANPIHTEQDVNNAALSSAAVSASSSDDEDPLIMVKEKRLHKLKRVLPQSSDKLGKYIDSLLSHLPERWRNWVVRGIFSV